MTKEVRVKDFETWNTSLSFMFGKTPKVSMVCGNCSHTFRRRFEPIDFRGGKYPRTLCPYCHTVNILPLTVSS